MPLLKSQTLERLRRYLRLLPNKRIKAFFYGVLPLSIIAGLMDLATVAVAARLAGTLVGNNLKDSMPGITVFNTTIEQQTILLILLLVVLSWATSIGKLLRLIFVQKLSAQVWRDVSNLTLSRPSS